MADIGDVSQLKVLAVYEQNNHVYVDVNPKARASYNITDNTIMPNVPGQKGLTAINRIIRRAHAEIGSMNQARNDEDIKAGGAGKLSVLGEEICKYCKTDIKKMGLLLLLDYLEVNQYSQNQS